MITGACSRLLVLRGNCPVVDDLLVEQLRQVVTTG